MNFKQFEFCSLLILSISSLVVRIPVYAQNSSVEPSSQTIIEIKKIKFEGNTVFSDRELKKVIESYNVKSEKISFEKLIEIRTIISDYYVSQGYLNSGAFLPSQEITNGKVSIRIVEGSLSKIEIAGLSHLNRDYILSRLPKIEEPLKTSDLTRALAKLRENPLVEDLQASMESISPGKYLLTVEVEQNSALSSQFILANNYSPSIGTFGGTINANYHLLGFGDILGVGYTKTEGLTRYSGSYLLPINKYNGTIGLRYTNANTEIVENPISALDIKANFESFSLEARQPISFNKQTELAFAIQFELIESETFVNRDFSFAFVDGLENGKSNLSVLRLTQEYFDRKKTSSIALRSQFNVGVDIFDSTVTEVGVDGLFWNWKGQGQWLQKIDDLLLLSSLNVQFTDDKLLPIEQLSLGGVNSVRGYRQNLSIGDNGIVGSIELQVPLVQKSHWKLNLIPFVDAGTLGNNFTEDLDYSTLASVGLGVNFTLGNTIDAQIDYGIPLIKAEAPESFSTEERVSFRLLFQP